MASITFEYTKVVSARSRSLRISIDAGGDVKVSVPRWTPQFVVDRFLLAHVDWVEHHLKKQHRKKKQLDLQKNQILIFGKKLIVEIEDARKIGVKITGEKLVVSPVSMTAASVVRSIERFCKQAGVSYITKRTEALSKKMKISYRALHFKTQKTRWGSCSSQGNLNFNWQLVHAEPKIIDYVIIHELAHRVHMDHSDRFWALVTQYEPHWKIYRNWLKQYGHVLHDHPKRQISIISPKT